MTDTNVELSFVVVSYNAPGDLLECVADLYSFRSELAMEIIVVDNKSTEANVRLVRERFPDVRLIENECNLGYGAAANMGVRQARGDFVAVLNSDLRFPDDIFPQLMTQIRSEPRFGCLGVQLMRPDGSRQKSVFRYPTLRGRLIILLHLNRFLQPGKLLGGNSRAEESGSGVRSVESVCGALLFIPRRQFLETGGFDENIFMYHEELDLCYRIRRAGFRIGFRSDLSIIHKGEHRESIRNRAVYLQRNRSLLYFFEKHYHPFRLLLLVGINLLYFFGRFIITGKRDIRQTITETIRLNLQYGVRALQRS